MDIQTPILICEIPDLRVHIYNTHVNLLTVLALCTDFKLQILVLHFYSDFSVCEISILINLSFLKNNSAASLN